MKLSATPYEETKKKKRSRLRLDPITVSQTKRLWRDYMVEHLKWIAFAVFWMMVVGGSSYAMVSLMQPAMDDALVGKDEDMVWFIAIGFLLVAITRGIGNFAQSVTMQMVGLRAIRKMQNQMFAALLKSEIQFFDREGTAPQLSRFIADTYVVRDAITKVFTGAGRDLVTLIFMIAAMIQQNWQLALFALLFFPLSIMPIARIGRRLRKVSEQTQAEFGLMTSVLDDSLKNARQVRAYGMQDYEAKRGWEAFLTTYKLIMKAVRTRALSYPIMDALAGVTLFTIILIGGYQVLAGTQTVGSFMAFFMAVFLANQPMRSLASLNNALQEGLGGSKRIFELIDREPVIQDRNSATTLPRGRGKVAVETVGFQYEEDKTVLHDVSLDFPAGKTVALVGPSGSGKTTILNLIPRFYDVTDGRITIDGHDVRDLTMASVMDQIALVSQEPSLFNDTVRANIRYGDWDASDAAVEEAAKNAAAHDFIMGLPDGYNTMVGENGLKLSGGQRQRIAIARAMLKNAPILLLDEATSALDAESEKQVQSALARLMEDRTTIVIAHRLSTIQHADRIYVMDNGRVVETGTHGELAAKGGLYARLCQLQFDRDSQGADVIAHPTAAAGE